MLLYVLQNMIKTPGRLFQCLLSATMVLALLFSAMAFGQGMNRSLARSGSSKNVILMGRGSEESVERSEVPPAALPAAQSIAGLEKALGQAKASPEVIYNTEISLPELNSQTSSLQGHAVETTSYDAVLRGVTPMALEVYPNMFMTAGRFPKSGEIMVGPFVNKKLGVPLEQLSIGQELIFEGQNFRISGHFASPGGVHESELWMNLGDIMSLTQRDAYSSITVRLDWAEIGDVQLMVKRRQDLQLSAVGEADYYRQLSEFYTPIRYMAWATAMLIAGGAFFGGLNSFFSAMEGRKKEFATLQAIGYGLKRLWGAMVLESLFLHLMAFLIAVVMCLSLFPQLTVEFGSLVFELQIQQQQWFMGLAFTLLMTVSVTVLPSLYILYPPIQTHLKD
jgi:putative ABC transport system permease protein